MKTSWSWLAAAALAFLAHATAADFGSRGGPEPAHLDEIASAPERVWSPESKTKRSRTASTRVTKKPAASPRAKPPATAEFSSQRSRWLFVIADDPQDF